MDFQFTDFLWGYSEVTNSCNLGNLRNPIFIEQILPFVFSVYALKTQRIYWVSRLYRHFEARVGAGSILPVLADLS